jgi:2',3'-cyclic-nucleotide 2'-phosphodiesterase (5'-nucleotidase family)
VRDFGIDAAVAGNHELDWGVPHLQRWQHDLPFPLLCANADLGLPATAMLAAGGCAVGVVGLLPRRLAPAGVDMRRGIVEVAT